MKLPRKDMLSHHHQQGNTATFCGQGKFEVFWCHIMDLLEVGGLSWGALLPGLLQVIVVRGIMYKI